jgi:hypothetical protein
VTPTRARIAAAIIVVALVGAGVASRQIRHSRYRPVAWRDIAPQLGSVIWVQPTISVIRSRSKLVDLLKVATFKPFEPSRPTLPVIDFARYQALLVALGPRSSSGYTVHVLSVSAHGRTLRVLIMLGSPQLGDHSVARLVSPYVLVRLPRTKWTHFDVRYTPS